MIGRHRTSWLAALVVAGAVASLAGCGETPGEPAELTVTYYYLPG